MSRSIKRGQKQAKREGRSKWWQRWWRAHPRGCYEGHGCVWCYGSGPRLRDKQSTITMKEELRDGDGYD